LLLRNEPELGQRITIVATTDAAPIPFLVASATCPDDLVAQLRAALCAFGAATECAELRDRLCLAGFFPVCLSDYDIITAWEREAEAAGYGQPT